MRTRRSVITAGAIATVAGMAGCQGSMTEPEPSENEPDIFPPKGPTTDDPLLGSIADPSLQVPPAFLSGYQYRLPQFRDDLDSVETVPSLGGKFLELISEKIENISIADCQEVTGSKYYSLWSTGPLANPVPSGQTVHVSGEFAANSFVNWLESVEDYESISGEGATERYIAETRDGSGFETWEVRDGLVVVVSRSEVTSRSDRYDDQEQAAQEALALEFNQIERDDAPVADTAPAFADTVTEMDSGPIRAATGFALIPQGTDTGTGAFDTVVSGVVGGGVRASAGRDADIQCVVSYLEDNMASAGEVEAAYAVGKETPVSATRWSFSVNGTAVHANASTTGTPAQETLRRVLPVPGYQELTTRISPAELNRAPNPSVDVTGEIVDGHAAFRHDGGDTIEDVEVRYVRSGEQQFERWDRVIEQGETLQTDRPIDSGTQAWLSWRPETSDAAVLARIRRE